MLLGIALNRTILWKVEGDSPCTIRETNANETGIVSVQEWIPLYCDWKSELMFPKNVPTKLSERQAIGNHQGHQNNRQVVFEIPVKNERIENVSDLLSFAAAINGEISNQSHVNNLYALESNFLYGMLFRGTLSMKNLTNLNPSSALDDSNRVDSTSDIVIVATSDSNATTTDSHQSIDQEVNCLLPRIDHLRNISNMCKIHLFISDNRRNHEQLLLWITHRNCSVVIHNICDAVNTRDTNVTCKLQQYNYFFQYLAPYSTTSDFVTYRSNNDATSLLIDKIEYNQKYESWRLGRDPPIKRHFKTCIVP
jgi:hypothetical protein